MLLTRAAGSLAAAASLFTLLGTACGSTSDRPGAPGSSAGGNSSAAPGSSGSGGLSLGVGGSTTVGSGASGVHDPTNDCAGDLVEAKYIPLDMYVMLDVSASMLDATEGNARVSKWQAVSSALIDFINDDESAGIGMGLQVFPVRHPEAPAVCTSSSQCGEFGTCFARVCWPFSAAGIQRCETNRECNPLRNPDGPTCIEFGVCENDTNYLCRVGDACGLDDTMTTDLGTCIVAPPSQCTNDADCRPAVYATAAAPIAELPGGSAALIDVIEAAKPAGLTPTGPALTGAIRAASAWALAHAEHQVITVLATDGLPTLTEGAAGALACARVTDADAIDVIDAVIEVAADGRAGTPSIPTFAIGVFGQNDVNGAPIMNAIARAGGTEQAFLVDTAGNVGAQFREALNAIRSSRLACELQLPEPAAGKKLDYHQINVVFDDGSGPGELDYYVDEAACAGKPGWHYDVDPDAPSTGGGTPQRIVACPVTCAAFGKVEMGSVAIKLGCVTRTPVK